MTHASGGNVLEGLRVIEIAGIGPGPFCAMHLADLGASVIMVERPDAQPRSSVQRGKQAIALDLKTREGHDTLLDLLGEADVLIEGMRPGVMERLGLGPDICRARNPRLVYGRMTGWGQHGPLSPLAGHDANYIAVSGALWHASPAGHPPVTPFSLAGDIAGGALYLAIGILAAVLRARQTGQGCVVDAAIVDGSAHALQLLLAGKAKGYIHEERGRSIHDASHFYASYRCADGRYVTVCAIEPPFYTLLLEKLALNADPAFARQWDQAQWPELRGRLQALFGSRTRAEWARVFEGSDACVAPVLSPEEAASEPHMVARGVYVEQDGFLQAVPAPRFDDQRHLPGPIPSHGEHGAAILSRLRTGGAAAVWPR